MLVTVAVAVAAPAWPLLSSARNRARLYVAGWVVRMNSWTIFANRWGWSLCGKWPAFGITSTRASGASAAGVAGVPHRDHLVVAAPHRRTSASPR